MPTRDDPPSVASLVARPPQDGTEVRVHGFLHATGGAAVVCDALAESWPPQPGGPTVRVLGLDVRALPGTSSHGGDDWSPESRTIRGVWEAGTIHDPEVVDR